MSKQNFNYLIVDLKKNLNKLKKDEEQWWIFADDLEHKSLSDLNKFLLNHKEFLVTFIKQKHLLEEVKLLKSYLDYDVAEEVVNTTFRDLDSLVRVLAEQKGMFSKLKNLNEVKFKEILNHAKEEKDSVSRVSQLVNQLLNRIQNEILLIKKDEWAIKATQVADLLINKHFPSQV